MALGGSWTHNYVPATPVPLLMTMGTLTTFLRIFTNGAIAAERSERSNNPLQVKKWALYSLPITCFLGLYSKGEKEKDTPF